MKPRHAPVTSTSLQDAPPLPPLRPQDATFKLHNSKLMVDGSFITEVHLSARTARPAGKSAWANASFWAAELSDFNTGASLACVSHLSTKTRKDCVLTALPHPRRVEGHQWLVLGRIL